MFVGFLAHSFATIANFQWFLRLPSPLNGMVEGNHWDQWFSDGFGIRQPLVMMVFDDCAPLVRRWNGYVPSLKSTQYPLPHFHLTRLPRICLILNRTTFSKFERICNFSCFSDPSCRIWCPASVTFLSRSKDLSFFLFLDTF